MASLASQVTEAASGGCAREGRSRVALAAAPPSRTKSHRICPRRAGRPSTVSRASSNGICIASVTFPAHLLALLKHSVGLVRRPLDLSDNLA